MNIAHKIAIAAFASLILLAPAKAAPFLIFFPSADELLEGDTMSIDVMMAPTVGQTVGAFEIDLTWSLGSLQFQSLEFGGFLGGDVCDFCSFHDHSLLASNQLIAVEVSFLFEHELEEFQIGDEFRLFSIDYLVVSAGSSVIELTSTLISGDGLSYLLNEEMASFSFNVLPRDGFPVAVPEPSSLALSIPVLLAWSWRRRKSSAHQTSGCRGNQLHS